MSTTKKKKPPKPKQQEVPGTERKRILKVTKAAEAYREARDERMELSVIEADAKEKLRGEMESANLTHYIDADADIEVTLTSNVKVSKPKKAKD